MDCFLQHFSPTPPVLWNKTLPVSCRVTHEEKMFETYLNWPLPTCDSARCGQIKWCFIPHGDLRIVSLFGGGKRESLGGTRKILRQPDLLPLAFPHWPFSVPVQKKQKGFGEKGSLFSSQSITNFKNLWRKTIEGFDLILSCFWGWIGQIWCVDSPRNTYMVVGSLLVTCIIGFIFVGYQERRLTWWKVTFTENQGCFVV